MFQLYGFFPVQKNFVAWQSSKHSDSKFQRTFSPTQPPLLPTHTREHTQSRHPQRVGVVGGVKMAATRDPSTSSKRSEATARCCCYLADPHGAFLHRRTIFSPNTHTHTHTHTHTQTNKQTNKQTVPHGCVPNPKSFAPFPRGSIGLMRHHNKCGTTKLKMLPK